MGFEPTHAVTRLPRFQHGLLSLLSNLPYMELVGVGPTSKHLLTYSSTTIGYVFHLTDRRHITQAFYLRAYKSLFNQLGNGQT